MRIRLLGGFEVSVGDPNHRGCRLAAEEGGEPGQAARPGHGPPAAPRAGDGPPLARILGTKAASNNLRGALHAARKALGPAGLPLPGLRGRVAGSVSRRATSGSTRRRSRKPRSAARRSRNPAAFRAAIDLYAGELLPGDRYEEWTEGRREALRRLYLALLIELAGLYEEQGRARAGHRGARDWRWPKSQPTKEAHAALMRLYALSGRPERSAGPVRAAPRCPLRRTWTPACRGDPTPARRDSLGEAWAGTICRSFVTGGDVRCGGHNLPVPRTSFVGREREMLGGQANARS